MKITQVGRIAGGQDGAFYGSLFFRFDSDGTCSVYDVAQMQGEGNEVLPAVARFSYGQGDPLIPHANSVTFGAQRYAPEDEFPLLYSNVYNNCAEEVDRHEGTCCVYRLQRLGGSFTMTLVQLIAVDFARQRGLWLSDRGEDVRPYGNFVVDAENSILYAYVMRDADQTTRYFAFDLPDGRAGTPGLGGVNTVTLGVGDVRSQFDAPYHAYIQGGCCHKGLIYSCEGFHQEVPIAIRIVDPAQKRQIRHIDLLAQGLELEPEILSFCGDRGYYGDNPGSFYRIDY